VKHHSLNANPDNSLTLERAAEKAEHLLLSAVKRQSLADVPVAALLSGGIDSSLVVASHRATARQTTRTLNVRFPDAGHDETPLALAVAGHCGTEHTTVDASNGALTPDAMISILGHFDQPFADTSCFPMYWVSSAIREKGIICALSGDGGDEAFGGYSRFWRANKLHRLMMAPSWVRALVRATGSAAAGYTRDWGRQAARAAALADAGRDECARLLAGMSNYLTEEQKETLVPREARENLDPCDRLFTDSRPSPDVDLEELSRRMSNNVFHLGLPGRMLRKVDMMSMRAGIEVRVPLLDENLVEFGLTLPHKLKTDGRQGKLVLRHIAGRWLPRDVARHPKHGFDIPLDVMVPRNVHEALQDLLCAPDSRTRPFVNVSLVRKWLTGFASTGSGDDRGEGRRRSGKRTMGGRISRGGLYQRVIALLSLEIWMRNHGLAW
jgi:asparagine synthase (glutamine-hydrolysing)